MEFTKEQLKSFIEAVVCNTRDYVMNNDGFIEDWVKENIIEKCQHKNINREDSMDECLDCGIRNY